MVDAHDMKSALKAVTVKAEKYTTKKIYKLATTSLQKRTEISLKCPVNVKVYDNDGNVCGVINNNKIDSKYSDIYMSVLGDQKTIYLAGDDYNFELTGTDSGTMDYIVKEFDEEGTVLREISYEKIALTEGCKYYAYVPETENLSYVVYNVTDKNENCILPTNGLDEEKKQDSVEIIDSGICGDNAKWTLDKDGVLRINGTGKMYNFENYYKPLTPTPWKDNIDKIKYVLIGDGITSIGNDSFYQCKNLCHVYIPDTVNNIGSYAFAFCWRLEEIIIPESVTYIGSDNWDNTFWGCDSDFIIYCPKESYAEEFAKKNKMKYKYISSTHEHKWDKGKITKQATCLEKGIKAYTCSICGKKKTAEISKLKPTIKLNINNILLNKNQVTTRLKVYGLEKGDYIKSWASSDTKIATIKGKSNGSCTIKAGSKTGTAKITITLASGLKKTITVTVSKKTVDCKSISNIPKKLTIKKKKTYQLKPVINPKNCTYKANYTTSNKKIAKVDAKGKITGVKKGTAKIMITVGKKKGGCVVTVK